METQGNEDAEMGCCCGPQMDMEMKNAVAIQRNAAAISAIIKSLQAIQSEVDEVKNNLDGLPAFSNITSRLTNVENSLSELQSLISGAGGIVERVNELEDAISGIDSQITDKVASTRKDVDAVMKTVYQGPRCEIMTNEGTFSVPIAQDAPEYDDDSTSHP